MVFLCQKLLWQLWDIFEAKFYLLKNPLSGRKVEKPVRQWRWKKKRIHWAMLAETFNIQTPFRPEKNN